MDSKATQTARGRVIGSGEHLILDKTLEAAGVPMLRVKRSGVKPSKTTGVFILEKMGLPVINPKNFRWI